VVAARERAWASADAAEGRQAFLEKRAAEFRGA
jgi:1,4-dihydroxy-2-naphthoyl-CoA synthase